MSSAFGWNGAGCKGITRAACSVGGGQLLGSKWSRLNEAVAEAGSPSPADVRNFIVARQQMLRGSNITMAATAPDPAIIEGGLHGGAERASGTHTQTRPRRAHSQGLPMRETAAALRPRQEIENESSRSEYCERNLIKFDSAFISIHVISVFTFDSVSFTFRVHRFSLHLDRLEWLASVSLNHTIQLKRAAEREIRGGGVGVDLLTVKIKCMVRVRD